MKFALALVLVLTTSPARAEATPDGGRLMRALEELRELETPKTEGRVFADGARRAGEITLAAAAIGLVYFYTAHYMPVPVVRRALVTGLRGTVAASAAALATGSTLWLGGHLYDAYMQDAYAQWATKDPDLYQTRRGLRYFFQLPIDEQFLYARKHAEFAEFLISLGEAQTLLREGFVPTTNPTVPRPE